MGMHAGRRSLRWRWIGVAALAILFIFAALVPAPSPGAIRKGFVRHQESSWVWYGPKSWFASSGPNDINIASPTGTLWLKFGSGGAVCPGTADEWFRGVRANYRQTAGAGFGLYSKPLRTTRYTSVGQVRQLRQSYFRQRNKWVGRRGNGQQIRGELIMDIFAIDGFGTCGQNLLSIGAPSKRNARDLGLLRDVFSTLANQSI